MSKSLTILSNISEKEYDLISGVIDEVICGFLDIAKTKGYIRYIGLLSPYVNLASFRWAYLGGYDLTIVTLPEDLSVAEEEAEEWNKLLEKDNKSRLVEITVKYLPLRYILQNVDTILYLFSDTHTVDEISEYNGKIIRYNFQKRKYIIKD